MKTIASLIAATALSGCAAGLLAAEVAAEAALYVIEDSGRFEFLGVMPEEDCEGASESYNKRAMITRKQEEYVCFPAEVSYDYDLIMED